MLPRAVVPIAALFMIGGMSLLFVPAGVALSWWVLPLGFGVGQLAIGLSVMRERTVRT
jgi:putative effector of murein hydrolase LrgA (UPF0299 family)